MWWWWCEEGWTGALVLELKTDKHPASPPPQTRSASVGDMSPGRWSGMSASQLAAPRMQRRENFPREL